MDQLGRAGSRSSTHGCSSDTDTALPGSIQHKCRKDVQFKFWQMLPNCSLKRLQHFILLPTVHENEWVSLYCSVKHSVNFERSLKSPSHPPSLITSGLLPVPAAVLTLSSTLDAHISQEPEAHYYMFVQAAISSLPWMGPQALGGKQHVSSFMFPVSIQHTTWCWDTLKPWDELTPTCLANWGVGWGGGQYIA